MKGSGKDPGRAGLWDRVRARLSTRTGPLGWLLLIVQMFWWPVLLALFVWSMVRS